MEINHTQDAYSASCPASFMGLHSTQPIPQCINDVVHALPESAPGRTAPGDTAPLTRDQGAEQGDHGHHRGAEPPDRGQHALALKRPSVSLGAITMIIVIDCYDPVEPGAPYQHVHGIYAGKAQPNPMTRRRDRPRCSASPISVPPCAFGMAAAIRMMKGQSRWRRTCRRLCDQDRLLRL
jgi:hypothetical protein